MVAMEFHDLGMHFTTYGAYIRMIVKSAHEDILLLPPAEVEEVGLAARAE